MRVRHFLEPLLRDPSVPFGLWCDGARHPLATRVEPAFDAGARRRGLLGREALPAGAALILAPCRAVHTFAMRFTIDLVFAARDGRVVRVRPSVRPGRVHLAWRAFAVVELPQGQAARAGVRVGDRLVLRA